MPTANPVLENSFKSYRISEGKVKIGREQNGDLEVLDSISGILKRIGYFEGEYDGDRSAYLEADLEDADGQTIRVKVSVGLNGTASQVAPVGMALGLLGCKQYDDIAFFPSKSKNPDPKYGKYQTYVDVGYVNTATGRYIRVDTRKSREDYPGATSKEKWPHVLEAIKKHEAYAERPTNDDTPGQSDDLSIFTELDRCGGWPSPFGGAKPTYLKLFEGMTNRPIKDYSDLTANEVKEFREYVEDTFSNSGFIDPPQELQPFLQQKAKGFGK